MTIFKSCRNSASVACTFYAIILTWKFDPFDLTLTLFPSIVNFDDVIGSKFKRPTISISSCKRPTKHVPRTVCLWLLFSSDLLWPDLDLFRYDLCTHAVSFSDIYQHFVWVWALFCPSNRLYSPKCKNSIFFLLLTWYSPYTWHLS